MAKNNWNANLNHFTYKNPVIRICLFALTLMALTIAVSYWVFSYNNYNTAQIILKIGGYIGAVILFLGWKKSYDTTKKQEQSIKQLYTISNNILLLLILCIIIAITAI